MTNHEHCPEHVLGGPACGHHSRTRTSILKNKTSGVSPKNDMEQSSSIAEGAQHCVEVEDGHSEAQDGESGTGGGGSGRATRSRDLFRWSSFSMKRLEPLLRVSTEISGMAQVSGRNCDESPIARKLKHGRKKQHLRNPYQRSYVAVFVALGIVVGMSAYQEVVIGVGVAGCGREDLFHEKCEGTLKTFVTRPRLIFRQVRCALTSPLSTTNC